MSRDDGGPAFPVEVDSTQPDGRQTGNTVYQAYGMTLRDWFAASVIGHLAVSPLRQENTIEHDANYAYRMADAMLKERAK